MNKHNMVRAKYVEFRDRKREIDDWWDSTCMLLSSTDEIDIEDVRPIKNKLYEELQFMIEDMCEYSGVSFYSIEVYNSLIDRICDIEQQLYDIASENQCNRCND